MNMLKLRRAVGGLVVLSGVALLVAGVVLQRFDAMVLGLAALLTVVAGLIMGLRFRVATLSALVGQLSTTMQVQMTTQLTALTNVSNETTGMVLRSFRDMEMAHREHAAEVRVAKEALATITSALDDVSRRIDDLSERTNEAFSAAPDQVTGALQAAMAPGIETSEKLMRQLIRESQGVPLKVTEAMRALPAPPNELAEKLMRQILRDVGKVPDGVAAKMDTLLRSDAKLNDLAHRALGKMQHETMQEAEALMQLYRLFDVQAPMPLLGGVAKGWAMEPVTMLAVVQEVLARKPGLIVECGSGTSTVWIGHALRRIGAGSLVSLEHLGQYARLGEVALAAHGLSGVAEIRQAPLEPCRLGDETFDWYETSTLENVRDVAMLIVDGPPSSTGPLARYPALPVMCDRLVPGALVLIDDVGREDEQRVVERWQSEHAALVNPRMISGRTMAFDYAPGHRASGNA